ncbi:DEAD/DEAH box helicase [Nitrosomonas halophila]|uniref:DEAD-box ATP-dependent RNA helicase RhpA n=1 Tax=Nitrosomonas halophila TaxID=44576 RepID=A0A1H3D8T0_9PROT|nr:DEAD/DEAH box helicase [Nitrosomonas halophila]SDX62756.1 ATP-dependent RNA helicase RhlE [Nitrosomonas halophila]
MSSYVAFDQLGLSSEILRAVADEGYVNPTPIQGQVIPSILAGRDVMASAQTGTGKTAGFTLPLLHRLQPYANASTSPAKHPVRALIMAPTRELAMQIDESVQKYGKYLALRSAVVFGGMSMDPQKEALRGGIEILVATPGRLLDFVEQKMINFCKTEILVLDEADRMLDMGFLPDIRRVMALLPEQRQSLMFSATFSNEIKKLADNLLERPVRIEVARQNAVNESISHVVHLVKPENKFELLVHLIKQQDLKQALIFAKTKHGASRLAQMLSRQGIAASAIHGDKNQQQRTQALNEFKQGEAQVLVATDVAARGLDIEKLSHVINFELPGTPEDYVHRIGRTGRAGSKGKAISLVGEYETDLLANIEKLLKTKLEVAPVDGFQPKPPVQTQPASPKGKRMSNGARSADVDNGRAKQRPAYAPKRPDPRRRSSSIPDDPIFTQPYVPKSSPVQPAVPRPSEARGFFLTYKQDKKPIPALFIPPVKNKTGQES